MNVLFLTDLEGIAGVTDIDFMDRTGEKYQIARGYLDHSINLAVAAAYEAGADTVYYIDGHANRVNVHEESIDPRAVRVSFNEWEVLLAEGKIDCQIELGAHARAGTVGGFLDHTMNSRKWFCLKINGREMSELSLHALVCSSYGVPIVGCIGDLAGCEQAKEYVPDIYTGAVKWASERNFATDYENADEILQSAVKNALANYKSVSFFRLSEPAVVELTYYRTDMCEEALKKHGDDVERVDARTLRRRVERLQKYSLMKF